ncbi:MAG: TIGR02391 family protein [Bacteroidales bacterium]|nr:TIGR02391 family protein [Bacteroidales bacterium]
MAKILTKCLPPNVLEMISNILGDTARGLTGSEIHRLLLQSNIEDLTQDGVMLAKRKNLFNSLANNQNKNKCSNQILVFIGNALAPSRYVDNLEEFERLRTAINQQLAFVGYELQSNGKYREIEKANTISDVQIKAESLKQELEKRKAHQEVFKYCKAELLQNNYFHSVLEANKGLFQRIRDLSGIETDGNTLIEQVFSTSPILVINDYQSSSEKNEHNGFCNLLKGLCAMFRNPTAHEPKIDWEITEQDALEILGIISYCHRRLDKAQKIR